MQGVMMRGLGVVCLAFMTCVLFAVTKTNAATMYVYPNTDPAGLTGNASTSWLGTPSGPQYNILRRTTYSESQFLCGLSGSWGFRYGLDDVAAVGQGAKSVTFVVSGKVRRSSIFTTPDDQLALGGYMNGASMGAIKYQTPAYSDTSGTNCALTFTNTTQNTLSQTYTKSSGYWTTAEINSLEIYLGRQVVGSADVMKVFLAYASIDYDAYPDLTTYQGRVYQDSNSTTPGTEISTDYVGPDKPVQLTSSGQKFRLRLNAYNTTGDAWNAGVASARLQYAKKTVASCGDQATGWTDVSATSSDMHFYDNPNISDGASISYPPGDFFASNGGRAQQYKESNPVALVNTLNTGEYVATWDFSMQADASAAGSYCFKYTPDSPATEYAVKLPVEVIAAPWPLGVDIVSAAGASVASPVVNFSALSALTQCQTSTATLGTVSQKIRITNGTATSGWSVSMAVAEGNTGKWKTANSASLYDYNDPTNSGCTDGSDADNIGGQLTISPSGSAIVPSSGCSTSGLTRGSNGSYDESATSSVTLMSASSSAQLNCMWDITGVGMSQKVPAATPPGSYSLDLVLTAVAL